MIESDPRADRLYDLIRYLGVCADTARDLGQPILEDRIRDAALHALRARQSMRGED